MGNLSVDYLGYKDYTPTIETQEEPKVVSFLGTSLKECHKDWYYSYKHERNYN